MITDFLIINCIGKDDKIGLRINNDFYVHDLNQKVNNNDKLVLNILNLLKKHKVNINHSFSTFVNNGPGSFSSIRVSLAVAKGLKISKNINLYSYKNTDLDQFDRENIELLITQELIQNKLIKPIYLS